MLRRADILTCEFYGLKINWFRCNDIDTEHPESSNVLNLAKQFLKIAYRIWTFGCGPCYFDRQLFLVGTETEDLIHRDWIKARLHETQLKGALARVWQEQDILQNRLPMSKLRQILTESYMTA